MILSKLWLGSVSLVAGIVMTFASSSTIQAEKQWVVYEGTHGPGFGRHIVLIAGDEEYRSEEALPMIAQILAKHHGFKCTVLFSINPEDGTIDPNNQTNIPGMHLLATADLVVLFTRFRELPDKDMKHFDDYVKRGKPIIGLRTATHGFNYSRRKHSPFAKYSFRHNGSDWKGGFGKEVFGETWVSHHGHHKSESTRGVLKLGKLRHPILKGVKDLWGPTDVYGINKLPADAEVLVDGQVLTGMKPEDGAVEGKKNEPMMPVAWTRKYPVGPGRTSRIFCTTFCSSVDLECEDLRRLLVNACFWGLKLEDKIPERANVDLVSPYEPNFYGNNLFIKGVKPSDLAWK
ncbi:MAG: ThuA domain-containing protein [Planctomycetaceae bacterium]|nr:ThuA domain-containing protein [Planctomycetaceae bacterium]